MITYLSFSLIILPPAYNALGYFNLTDFFYKGVFDIIFIYSIFYLMTNAFSS